MRKIFIFLASVFIFLLISASCPAAVVDRIVALVNNDVITLSELEETGKKLFDQVKNTTLPDERPAKMRQAREEVLERLVENKLLEQEIRERKIEITDRQVNDTIQDVMESNKLTENELKAVLAKDGVTYSVYRQRIREELGKMRLINREIKSKIVIQDDSLYSYYQEHLKQFTDATEIKVQRIFFPVPRSATDEARISPSWRGNIPRARKLRPGDSWDILSVMKCFRNWMRSPSA
jgi:peptidyl-prolyl cis-trans isomerase SurA